MHLISPAAGLALLALAGCESTVSPSGPPSGDLDGKWGWELNGNPGGAYMTFSLWTAGNSVDGAGVICTVGPSCNPGPVAITGEHVPGFGPFSFSIKGGAGYAATYTGQFAGIDQLRGTWAEGSQSRSVILNRCTATGC